MRLRRDGRGRLCGSGPRLVAARTFRGAVGGDVLDALGG